MQDFNAEVISKCTDRVFKLNGTTGTLLYGSWDELKRNDSLRSCFDVIIMSETLYNVQYYESLFEMIEHCLAPGGIVIVGTKTFYYGLGGGLFELDRFLKDRYTGKP